jgi:NADPH-dependent 2,4-dienoyl-CoA reductase/sulfur reductase-like enzyme/rhodanese-related sulfurtransferase
MVVAMPKRYVVIGGVAAGPKAAARARRLDPDAEITIIEKEEILSYAGCGLPYWISGLVKDRNTLISTPVGVLRDPQFFAKAKDIRAMNRTEATEIDRDRKEVECRSLETGEVSRVPYDKLVIATGSRPFDLPIPGADLKKVLHLKDPDDASQLRDAISVGCRKVAIVGGGLIGCEMTEAVSECGKQVTIIEMLPHILPGMLDEEMALILEKNLKQQGVSIQTNTRVERLEGNDKGEVAKVITSDGLVIDTEFVLMAVGVRPVTELAQKAGLEIGEKRGIKVNSRMQTSDPDIYAAGDCIEHPLTLTQETSLWPMGSVANKEGRVAGTNMTGGDEEFAGIVQTNVVKVFDQNVGRTGLTEASAIEKGYDVTTAIVASPDRAHYYPGAAPIVMKAIADTNTRKLLGLQGIGKGDVVKRVDIASTAIFAGMTVDHVANLDLAYAPPYSSAMDPIIVLANILRNKLDGLFEGITPTDVKEKMDRGEDFFFLDVRGQPEYETIRIPGATLIPLGALRGRLDEVPRDKEVITFCKISLRGYEAARILYGKGYENVKVMEGGVLAWPFETES